MSKNRHGDTSKNVLTLIYGISTIFKGYIICYTVENMFFFKICIAMYKCDLNTVFKNFNNLFSVYFNSLTSFERVIHLFLKRTNWKLTIN